MILKYMNRTRVYLSRLSGFEDSNVIDTLQMSGLKLFEKIEQDPEIDITRRRDVR